MVCKIQSGARSGFTLVELLVVAVVMVVLFLITILGYDAVRDNATSASLKSDLVHAYETLKIFRMENGAYPTTIDCAQPDSSTNKCVEKSNGATYYYDFNNSANPKVFGLTATKGNISYRIANNSIPVACAPGFIIVPGSSTYGTKDFCVMKYEAKNPSSDNSTPVSQAATSPWVSINQYSALNVSKNVAGCNGCHLITEAEWLTIMQNVLSVPSNWSGGAVGSGYIYSGHNDDEPTGALVADSNDNNGYAGETNTGGDQRRTLTLTDGEVIWDLAGNVYEWTAGTTTGNQPGVSSAGYVCREWTAITTHGTISPDPFPSYTGLTGSGTWDSSKGIGEICSSTEDNSFRGFLRGGYYNQDAAAGVTAISMGYGLDNTAAYIGFRVAR